MVPSASSPHRVFCCFFSLLSVCLLLEGCACVYLYCFRMPNVETLVCVCIFFFLFACAYIKMSAQAWRRGEGGVIHDDYCFL